jgi:hypothetical protein
MLNWFKWHWSDDPQDAQPGMDPDWTYYEVDVLRDNVLRHIELYPDGTALRNSLALATREGPDHRPPEHRSLVSGRFLTNPDNADWAKGLVSVSQEAFDTLWHSAVDMPLP